MPGPKLTFDIVRKIGRALPGVQEGSAYRSPALRVRGSLLACLPVHRSAEPESLAVAMDLDRRSELLAEAPETYYVTDHYVDCPVVLVRLPQLGIEQLQDLLGSAWRFVTSQERRTASRPTRGKRNTARRESRQR